MDILTIAARISSASTRCACGLDKVYDDGRDAYFCVACGIGDGHIPSVVTAGRKRRRKKPAKVARPAVPPPAVEPPGLDMLQPKTEFSVRAEIALAVDFEGDITKSQLVKKLRNEIMAAIRQAVKITADELRAEPSTVVVQPISFDVAMNDQADLQDEIDG